MLSRTLLLSFLCSLDSSFPLSRAFNGHSYLSCLTRSIQGSGVVAKSLLHLPLEACFPVVVVALCILLQSLVRARVLLPMVSVFPRPSCSFFWDYFVFSLLSLLFFLFFSFKRLNLQPDNNNKKKEKERRKRKPEVYGLLDGTTLGL